MKTERKISNRFSVAIEKNDRFGCAVGTPQTKYTLNLYDLENYHDPGHRTWYLHSPDELRRLRDIIDNFLILLDGDDAKVPIKTELRKNCLYSGVGRSYAHMNIDNVIDALYDEAKDNGFKIDDDWYKGKYDVITL